MVPKLRSIHEAAADEWNFVEPSVAVGPGDDLDRIDRFSELKDVDGAHYGTLEMGPEIDEDGNIKYTTHDGIPSYLHVNSPKNSYIPDYCGNDYSKTIRWIKFRKVLFVRKVFVAVVM